MTEQSQPAPGTAGLYEIVQALQTELHELRQGQAKIAERRRAIWLCFVDEDETALGYGQPDAMPRTAQIRQYWREQGKPEVRSRDAG